MRAMRSEPGVTGVLEPLNTSAPLTTPGLRETIASRLGFEFGTWRTEVDPRGTVRGEARSCSGAPWSWRQRYRPAPTAFSPKTSSTGCASRTLRSWTRFYSGLRKGWTCGESSFQVTGNRHRVILLKPVAW